MTRLIDIHDMTRLLQQTGLEEFLRQLVDVMEQNFKRWQQFDKSARLASHSDIGVIELMPTADQELYGFKFVNGHPGNTLHGLSTVMAFGALAQVSTGYPLLISELTLATALRTAATSVMAAKLLARENAQSMAMIGCGAQSEFQSIAFHSLLGIRQIHIYDVDHEAMLKLQHNLASYSGLTVKLCASTAEAVENSDIITTCTADKTHATILTPEMIQPGMHINALGGDCPGKTELHRQVLEQSDIFVEYEPQTRIEGDIQQLGSEHPVTELWQLLTGDKPGRNNFHQITVFDSVGFALEDFSTLYLIHRLSQQQNIGRDIDLIPQLPDPKNLFSMMRNGHSQNHQAA